MTFFPTKGFDSADIDEFNRQTDFDFTSVRDFIILHYKVQNREGAFWTQCREMDVPDSLANKIELFKANGRISRYNDELFTELGWLQVLWGQGLRPTGYHPLADQLSTAQLGEFMELAHKHAAHVAGQMPLHKAYIAAKCAAPPLDMQRAMP